LQLELKVLADVGCSACQTRANPLSSAPFPPRAPKSPIIRSPRCTPTSAWCAYRGEELRHRRHSGPDRRRGGRRGLGHQFLRHLARTRVLLHLVDIAPMYEGVNPVADARAILNELKKYDPALYQKPAGCC